MRNASPRIHVPAHARGSPEFKITDCDLEARSRSEDQVSAPTHSPSTAPSRLPTSSTPHVRSRRAFTSCAHSYSCAICWRPTKSSPAIEGAGQVRHRRRMIGSRGSLSAVQASLWRPDARYLKREYGEAIPQHNLHFIMRTMASHMRTFIIIGLLRSTVDPNDVTRQGSLF